MTTKERPIIFSAPMVRAILAGTKRQTRRVVKGESTVIDGMHYLNGQPLEGCSVTLAQCPYGQPGDRLWVREAWRSCAEADSVPPRDMDAAFRVWYEADAPHQPGAGKYRPPMFMPRWASRITLEITDVRVQRLHEISVADAMAEGVVETNKNLRGLEPCLEWIYAYEDLWESINGPGSWDANPWVWVVEFKMSPQHIIHDKEKST